MENVLLCERLYAITQLKGVILISKSLIFVLILHAGEDEGRI